MKNKRMAAVLLAAMIGAMAVGCGDAAEEKAAETGNQTAENGAGTETEQKDTQAAEEQGKEETPAGTNGYAFEYQDVVFSMDMDVTDMTDLLGEPNSYFEEPSCAAEGIGKLYTYSGFELETYPDGENDLVACIILKDDSVATQEGVDLSMGREDIVAAYGEADEETDTSLVYRKDGMKLLFVMEGDTIASIEYDSGVLE